MKVHSSSSGYPIGTTGSLRPKSRPGNNHRMFPKLSKLLGRRQNQGLLQQQELPATKQNIYKQHGNHALLASELQPSLTNSTDILTDKRCHDDEAAPVAARASFSVDNEEIYRSTPALLDLETSLNETLANIKNFLVDFDHTEPSDTSSLTTLSSLGSCCGPPIHEMGGWNGNIVCTTENECDVTIFPDFSPPKQSYCTTEVESTRVPTPISRPDSNPWPVREINEEALGQLSSSWGRSEPAIFFKGFDSNSPIKPIVVEDFRDVRANLRKVEKTNEFGPSSMKAETTLNVYNTTSTVTIKGATKEQIKAINDFPQSFSSQTVQTQELLRHSIDPKAGLNAMLPPGRGGIAIGTQNSAFAPIGSLKTSSSFGGPCLQSPITLVGDKKGDLPTPCQKRKQPRPFPTRKYGESDGDVPPVTTSEVKRSVVAFPHPQEENVHQRRIYEEEKKMKSMLARYHDMKKIGIPIVAIHKAMLRDGVDPSLFDSAPGATNKKPIIGIQDHAFNPIGSRKTSTGFGGPCLKSPITLVGDKKEDLPTQCQKREQPRPFPTRKYGDNGYNHALTVATSQTIRAVVWPPVKDEPHVTHIAPLMVENPMIVKCHNMKGSSLLNGKRQEIQQQISFPTKMYCGNGGSDLPPVLTSEVQRSVVAFPHPQEYNAQQNAPHAIYEEKKTKNMLAKYHDMKKIGIPIFAIQNAMLRDGVDPSLFDSAPGVTNKKLIETKTVVPKDNYCRTRLQWETHPGSSAAKFRNDN